MRPGKLVKTGTSGVRRLLRLKRTYGGASVLYAILDKILRLTGARRGVRIYAGEIYGVALADWKGASRVPKSFVVRWAQAADLPAVADYFGKRQKVRERFERGDRCVLTLWRDQISAAVWLTLGPKVLDEDWDELRCKWVVPGGIVFTFDGKGTRWGAWGALMARLPDLLNDTDVAEVITLINPNNWKSVDSHRSLGFENMGTVGCVGLGRFTRCFYKPRNERWRLLADREGKLIIRHHLQPPITMQPNEAGPAFEQELFSKPTG